VPAARAYECEEGVEPHPQARDESAEHQGAVGLRVWTRGRDPVRDGGAVIARHPDALSLDSSVQIPTLQEGIEGGEEVRHGTRR
jgi:hypothetical protein